MRISGIALLSVLLILSFSVLLGCTQEQPPAPPPGLNKDIEQAQRTIENQSSNGGSQLKPIEVEPVSQGNESGVVDWSAFDGNTSANNTQVNVSVGNETGANKGNGSNGDVPPTVQKSDNTRPANSFNIENGTFGLTLTPYANMNVYFIDVGFGNAVFVNKGTFNMLIDAGGVDYGSKVSDFIKARGVEKLNVVVATHDDANYIGGLPAVLRAFEIDEVWLNNVSGTSNEYKELMSTVSALGIPIKYPYAKQKLSVNDMDVTVLNPQQQRIRSSNPQTDSVILKLKFRKFCALLLDPTVNEIGPAIAGTNEPIACQVVEYFNHGEARSPGAMFSLVDTANPSDIIISVGSNSQNLPNPTTITWIQTKTNPQKWNLYRTDQKGTITVSADSYSKYTITSEK